MGPFLLAGVLLLVGPVAAQQPIEQKPSERLPGAERPGMENQVEPRERLPAEARRRGDAQQEAVRMSALSQTEANLVTRAAAGLTGVENSATSTADVNGDGNEDLLITGDSEIFNPTTKLYLGSGDGSFQAANAGLTGVTDGGTSIADVDGDGNQDLLITGNMASGSATNPSATLYLGNGDGSFEKANAGLTDVSSSSTSIADINGDGDQDLLITGEDGFRNSTATLYLGNGDGSFEEANADLAGVKDAATSIADVDGDGNQDLLITGSGTATLYLGSGDGSFEEANAGLAGVEDAATSIADMDGDGDKGAFACGGRRCEQDQVCQQNVCRDEKEESGDSGQRPATAEAESCLTEEEQELLSLIRDYRDSNSLDRIPASKSLTNVARAHVRDLAINEPHNEGANCNGHSWSDEGNWSACCYTPDHERSQCMWSKPDELTGYEGVGYEIASRGVTSPKQILANWQSSSAHNAVIVNGGRWADLEWKAIGVGIYEEYAVVWFGEMDDPAEDAPPLCSSL